MFNRPNSESTSRTKVTAVATVMAALIGVGCAGFGWELPVDNDVLYWVLIGGVAMAQYFLRDAKDGASKAEVFEVVVEAASRLAGSGVLPLAGQHPHPNAGARKEK